MLAHLLRAVGLHAAQASTRCQQTSRCRRYTLVTLVAQDFHLVGGHAAASMVVVACVLPIVGRSLAV
jgi:hypothetical protein